MAVFLFLAEKRPFVNALAGQRMLGNSGDHLSQIFEPRV